MLFAVNSVKESHFFQSSCRYEQYICRYCFIIVFAFSVWSSVSEWKTVESHASISSWCEETNRLHESFKEKEIILLIAKTIRSSYNTRCCMKRKETVSGQQASILYSEWVHQNKQTINEIGAEWVESYSYSQAGCKKTCTFYPKRGPPTTTRRSTPISSLLFTTRQLRFYLIQNGRGC